MAQCANVVVYLERLGGDAFSHSLKMCETKDEGAKSANSKTLHSFCYAVKFFFSCLVLFNVEVLLVLAPLFHFRNLMKHKEK